MPKPRSELFGISDKEIARICAVSLKTAQRWKAGQSVPPETALMVLRIKWAGDLAELGPEWAGWRFRGGELTSPDGWRINRNDALAVPLMHGQIDALRAKVAGLEATHDALGDQPEPSEWEDLPIMRGISSA